MQERAHWQSRHLTIHKHEMDNTVTENTAPAAGTEQQNQRGFNLAHQYVKDLSFENPNASEVIKNRGTQPQFKVEVNTTNRELGGGAYEVDLIINASATIGEQQAFIVECVYSGVTVLGTEIIANPQLLEAALVVETPRMLFPFARQVVSDATANGGYPPLLLHPINFNALLQQKKKAQAEDTSGQTIN